MEFRYRAVDSDRPSTTTETSPSQPPNPSFSFIPPRPMLGCNIEPNEDRVREAIQREIEKEKIRQEIIAAETLRRRELIAEVLQEMAVEREMAIRRVAETKGMWLPNQNQNNNVLGQNHSHIDPMMQLPQRQQMPEATQALESNKDKLIVLSRADDDPIGGKRKAEDNEAGLERSKRIAIVETGETVSSNLPSNGKQQQVESKPKGKFKFWCEVCSVGAFTQTVMTDHELGKKHIAAIKQQNEKPHSAATSIQSEATNVLQNANVEDQKPAAKEIGKRKVIIRCETCDIQTYSEKVMETHKLGKKHKAMVEKQQCKAALAVLDTNVIAAAPVRSLDADDDIGEKDI